jgi:hypothetical protein
MSKFGSSPFGDESSGSEGSFSESEDESPKAKPKSKFCNEDQGNVSDNSEGEDSKENLEKVEEVNADPQ